MPEDDQYFSIQLSNIEELKGEQNYYEKIKRIEGEGKLWKDLEVFDTLQQAEDYISCTPANRKDSGLLPFIPDTKYVTQLSGDKVKVIAISQEIKGIRLDKYEDELPPVVLSQLDRFMEESLKVFEKDKVTPGVNLKNFIIDPDQRLFYIDSEPYPPANIETFEMARARERRLIKMFGKNASSKLPITWQWIKGHMVEDYQKAKSEAKKNRRLQRNK
jgi:hypothetical protein